MIHLDKNEQPVETDDDTAEADDFPEQLAIARMTRNLTQAALGARCGMSQAQIGHFETGRLPSLKSLYRLRAGLGCSWDELLGAPDAAKPGNV